MDEVKERRSVSPAMVVFGSALAITIALAVGFALLVSGASFRAMGSALQPGEMAPRITAEGWLNGDPAALDGRDRVMLVHAWYTTCPHCRTRTPVLKALHERYGDRVDFVGLTFEGESELEEVSQYVHETGMTWPNGYGARETLDRFFVSSYPAAWVIDAEGRVIWNSDSSASPEEAIEQALRSGRQ